VNATLSALGRRPLEMFHDIRDIDLSAVNTSLGERFIQKFSRRSDKWLSQAIFLVARLFAHEHDRGFRIPLSEDRLRRGLPKITRLTSHCLLS
jgi:hypothetical protein